MHQESQERIPEFTSSLAKVETSLVAVLALVSAREDNCAHVIADQKVFEGILAKMDNNLMPLASTGESKVFYCIVEGDNFRYLADCAAGDAVSKAAMDARVACAEDTEIARNDVVVAQPIFLSVTLNYSVSRHSVQTKRSRWHLSPSRV